MTEDRPSSDRKKRRVRFQEDAEVRHYEPESPKHPAYSRRGALAALFLPESDEGEGSGAARNDADIDWDVPQPSEAHYDDPAELYNDAGIPIEPFHLHEEREEGYFDRESGSYVRLRKKDAVDDAWADALAVTEVNDKWAAAVLGRRPRTVVEPEDEEASHEEVVLLKRRIAGLLLPRETALMALRRLGRARAGDATSSVVRGRVGLTPEARSDFDRLTEYCAALMEAGEYMAHSLTREELMGVQGSGNGERDENKEDEDSGGQRLAEELLKAAAAAAGVRGASVAEEEPPAAVVAAVIAAGDDVDMFAADEEPAAPPPQSAKNEPPGDAPSDDGGTPLQGFVLDPTTGYFYNSNMGAYYDPQSRLFGDAASGTWWRLDAATGKYIAA